MMKGHSCIFHIIRLEGIIPALEAPMRCIRYETCKGNGNRIHTGQLVRRGDKDMDYVIEKYGERLGIKY